MQRPRGADLRDLSPAALLLIGLGVTGVALLESWQGWIYAPFPVGHALLCLLVPLWYGALHLGPRPPDLRAAIRPVLVPLAVALVFIGAYVLLYDLVLHLTGRIHDPNWNLLATYRSFGRLYVHRYDRTTVAVLGYLLIGVWPMFGEEFFYRGFLFKGLLRHTSPATAAIVSSCLFGLRHAFQLTYLLPAYPVVSGVAYFVWAAGLGLLWAWAYHRSHSLWPCVLTHGANLILAPVAFIIVGL